MGIKKMAGDESTKVNAETEVQSKNTRLTNIESFRLIYNEYRLRQKAKFEKEKQEEESKDTKDQDKITELEGQIKYYENPLAEDSSELNEMKTLLQMISDPTKRQFAGLISAKDQELTADSSNTLITPSTWACLHLHRQGVIKGMMGRDDKFKIGDFAAEMPDVFIDPPAEAYAGDIANMKKTFNDAKTKANNQKSAANVVINQWNNVAAAGDVMDPEDSDVVKYSEKWYTNKLNKISTELAEKNKNTTTLEEALKNAHEDLKNKKQINASTQSQGGDTGPTMEAVVKAQTALEQVQTQITNNQNKIEELTKSQSDVTKEKNQKAQNFQAKKNIKATADATIDKYDKALLYVSNEETAKTLARQSFVA